MRGRSDRLLHNPSNWINLSIYIGIELRIKRGEKKKEEGRQKSNGKG